MVGATGADIGSQSNQGAAYIFTNLYTATGNIVQNLKLVASDGAANDNFGRSVTLDGDRFVVGATGGDGAVPNSGKAYMGTVSSMTTLNLGGGGTRSIDGISFISQEDWIIGDSWDNNSVTLTAGDSANVTVSGKKVYVGRHASSDNNTLSIEGSLTANEILVGASGNTGNHLQVDGTVTVSSGLLIAGGSSLGGDGTITGDVTFDLGAKFVFQLDLPLTITGTVWMDSSFGIDDLIGLNNSVALGTYKIIEGTGTDFSLLGLENWGASNAYDLGAGKYAYFQQGSLEVVVVPEPSTWALLILSGLGLGLFRRRSLRAVER